MRAFALAYFTAAWSFVNWPWIFYAIVGGGIGYCVLQRLIDLLCVLRQPKLATNVRGEALRDGSGTR